MLVRNQACCLNPAVAIGLMSVGAENFLVLYFRLGIVSAHFVVTVVSHLS
jgi:hypothetical protein